MAAAYQTGSALGSVDLLQKLVTFLVSQGWATNLSAADGAGWRAHLNKGAFYINLRAYTGADATNNVSPAGQGDATKAGISLFMGTGFNGANPWWNQAGGARADLGANILRPNMWLRSDSVLSYHFLDDGFDHILVEAESVAGVHNYMGFGTSIEKAGAFTWGEYYFASAPVYILNGTGAVPGWGVSSLAACANGAMNSAGAGPQSSRSFVRADVDAYADEWVSFGAPNVGAGSNFFYGFSGIEGTTDVPGELAPYTFIPSYSSIVSRTSNSFNGRTVLLPAHAYVKREGGGYSLLGSFPDLFVGYGDFSPGQVYAIGADDYLAFPTSVARYMWFVRKRA